MPHELFRSLCPITSFWIFTPQEPTSTANKRRTAQTYSGVSAASQWFITTPGNKRHRCGYISGANTKQVAHHRAGHLGAGVTMDSKNYFSVLLSWEESFYTFGCGKARGARCGQGCARQSRRPWTCVPLQYSATAERYRWLCGSWAACARRSYYTSCWPSSWHCYRTPTEPPWLIGYNIPGSDLWRV